MQASTKEQKHVWVIQVREYVWVKSRFDLPSKKYWGTTNDAFLSRKEARERAKMVRNSGEEVRIRKFSIPKGRKS